ncbi:MAG: hypothetical protein HYS12_13435 [Planctomycetes bacterium]|nr:hypothetical protein [Planctomycetota bacterium]
MLTNDEFASQVMALAGRAEDFKPTAIYDPDGDCIEFLVSPDSFYAERVDDLVTVYYSQETREIIGSLIKGVGRFYRTLLKEMPGFFIEVIDGRVKLVHLFRARVWTSADSPNSVRTITYRKLIQAAEESKVETDFQFAA